MNYKRPDYIDKMPEEFQDYFNEELFKNTPYPPTLDKANDYLLHEVFKADKKEIITIMNIDKTGTIIENATDFTREDYWDIFNFENWKKITPATKIVALYWFYEDICKELKIYKPDFYFIKPLPENAAGYYSMDKHCFVFNLNCDEDVSAYDDLNTIAHELKHAEQFSKVSKSKKYFKEYNKNFYFGTPNHDEYDPDKDYERFCYLYDLTFYFSQPTEAEAYNYGHKKLKKFLIKQTSKLKKMAQKF